MQMRRMVISCCPDGSVQHTLKDGFLNPFPGQDRHIERMTVIEHDEAKQLFFVRWLKGPHNGRTMTLRMFSELCTSVPLGKDIVVEGSTTAYFKSYEEAVEAEIDAVNNLRLSGHSLTE